jgi:hypothetical protein
MNDAWMNRKCLKFKLKMLTDKSVQIFLGPVFQDPLQNRNKSLYYLLYFLEPLYYIYLNKIHK